MAVWLAFSLGILPALVWLVFFLLEDRRRPEPKGLVLAVFVLGGIAAFIALQIQIPLNEWLRSLQIIQTDWRSIFLMAGVEEIVKFVLVYIWIYKQPAFDEPLDAMIYMIIAALGFATLENVASVWRSPSSGLELMVLRFIGATLLHSLSSGLAGFYWAKALAAGRSALGLIVQGIALATLVHTIFNGLVLNFGPLWETAAFLAFVGFFVLSDFEKLKSSPPFSKLPTANQAK